jgi:hypothetical protein
MSGGADTIVVVVVWSARGGRRILPVGVSQSGRPHIPGNSIGASHPVVNDDEVV